MSLPKKSLFELPKGIIYLDGNSLGALPKGAASRAAEVITNQWGGELIRAWNSADWMSLPQMVGDRIAKIIGADAGTVATGDTLSIKIYQALDAALKLRPNRKVILSDNGNFPSDIYMANGLIRTLGDDYELRLVAPEDVMMSITDDVAVVMLTQIDYRTGRMHDMASITKRAHDNGAVMIWDLAHSVGAVPLDLKACRAEFAVGCTYKYLNGGPGAPAFIYARPDIVNDVEPVLSGWMGHKTPFTMDLNYQPAIRAERFRVGTPPIVQLSILDAALDMWDDISMPDIRDASIELSELFIKQVEAVCPVLKLVSPKDADKRGSHVSFAFEYAYEAIQALIDKGVIGDFRAPNIMRFGITPLYIDREDIIHAAEAMGEVINNELYNNPKYKIKARVT